MKHWIRTFGLLVWSLWFGGIIALFIFVQTLFHSVPRDTFVLTAPHLFFIFERYQLALAAIALAITLIWRVFGGGGRATIAFAMFAAAALLAVAETAAITPRIERLRIAGQTQTQQFMKLHGMSMAAYLTESIILLLIGLFLVSVPERKQRGGIGD